MKSEMPLFLNWMTDSPWVCFTTQAAFNKCGTLMRVQLASFVRDTNGPAVIEELHLQGKCTGGHGSWPWTL